MTRPTEHDASTVASEHLHEPIKSVHRFDTGAANRVFDVTSASGRRIVVRFSASADDCRAAVCWSGMLRPLGVPLPEMLGFHVAERAADFSWQILERLQGRDLGDAYPRLSAAQKMSVLDRVLEAQCIVHSLPSGGGFGYATVPQRAAHASWKAVVIAELDRAERRIEQVGVIDPRHVDRIRSSIAQFEGYFAAIEPRAFLDDTTTKNVIVDWSGEFQGIVDVDCVCYGDSLIVPALTRMSLLSLGYDTQYTDAWLDRTDRTAEHRRACNFYTAMFCANFLSEQGQQFNRDAAPPVDSDAVKRLLSILDHVLQGLE